MNETIEMTTTPTAPVKRRRTRTPKAPSKSHNDNFKQFRVANSVHADVMEICDVMGLPTNTFFLRLVAAVKPDLVENGTVKETPISRQLLGLSAK